MGEQGTSKPTVKGATHLRQQWYNEFIDILEGTKEELRPCERSTLRLSSLTLTKAHVSPTTMPNGYERRVPHQVEQVYQHWMGGTSNNITGSTTNVRA